MHVIPKPGSKFGQIETGCYIEIICFLDKIQIHAVKDSISDLAVVKGSYAWQITGARTSYTWHWVGRKKNKIAPEIYFDSPRNDLDSIQGEIGCMYCVPVYEDGDGNFICLLLQWLEEVDGLEVYRRVGLTIISYYQADQQEIRKLLDPCFGKRQRIRLV